LQGMANTPLTPRYAEMDYRRCGRSGLKLPGVSLGLWHNFGGVDAYENARDLIRTAFEAGITHFDLANNYGPPPGSAEETFGRILKTDLAGRRDEVVISTKAGYTMWAGPYGDFGSRKYLLSSLDQSLSRLGLDRVDIFYHHRPDPETPLEETMGALASAVKQGKAIYAGLSNYGPEKTAEAAAILRSLGTPCLIHQPRYSLLDRRVEGGLLDVLDNEGIGCIVFSPLEQGLLTDRYLESIPKDSRAGRPTGFLRPEHITDEKLKKVAALREIAVRRGQTMAQMALAWTLKRATVTSTLIGASKPAQIADCLVALKNTSFTEEEIAQIDAICLGS
jgi:L-glyceraldehyde 3-phosphate reductase